MAVEREGSTCREGRATSWAAVDCLIRLMKAVSTEPRGRPQKTVRWALLQGSERPGRKQGSRWIQTNLYAQHKLTKRKKRSPGTSPITA